MSDDFDDWYQKCSQLDDEEDKLVDQLLANAADDFTAETSGIERKHIEQFQSIRNRRKYGSKLDEENLAQSELMAAIENDDELEKAIEQERKRLSSVE